MRPIGIHHVWIRTNGQSSRQYAFWDGENWGKVCSTASRAVAKREERGTIPINASSLYQPITEIQ